MDIIGDMLAAAGDLTFWALVVIGVLIGLMVGVLPGLTFVMGVLLILPFTYSMTAGQALVLMVAVYVAGTYGGAFTAILMNIPGEPNDVALLRDGHTMTRRGRGAEALGWAALAALVGGIVALAGAGLPLGAVRVVRAEVRLGGVLRGRAARPHERPRAVREVRHEVVRPRCSAGSSSPPSGSTTSTAPSATTSAPTSCATASTTWRSSSGSTRSPRSSRASASASGAASRSSRAR